METAQTGEESVRGGGGRQIREESEPRSREGEPAWLEHPLHVDDVEPAAELAADLALGADAGEAAAPVERDGRLVAADDAGDRPSGSRGRRPGVRSSLEQGPADALGPGGRGRT